VFTRVQRTFAWPAPLLLSGTPDGAAFASRGTGDHGPLSFGQEMSLPVGDTTRLGPAFSLRRLRRTGTSRNGGGRSYPRTCRRVRPAAHAGREPRCHGDGCRFRGEDDQTAVRGKQIDATTSGGLPASSAEGSPSRTGSPAKVE